MKSDKNMKKGITLLENVLAIMITAIVIGGLIQLFITAPMQVKIANHRVSALNLVQAKIEQLKSLGYDGVVTANYNPPQQEAVVIDTGRPQDASDDLKGIRRTSVTDITDAKKIVVEVRWAEFGNQFSDFAETLIYDLD